MKLSTLITVTLLLISPTAWAQSELDGVWQIVESHWQSPEGEWKFDNVQPSLYIFYEGYYSSMQVWGNEARPLMAADATRESITDEEMRSIMMPFFANSGTYEVSGSTFTLKPMIALWPNFMEGGSETYTFDVAEDMLSLSIEGEGRKWTAKLQRLR